jgi:cell division transport system permease protein
MKKEGFTGMKIKTVGYHFNQSLKSVARNRMMSIASITTVMATLLVLGVFYVTMSNANFAMKNVGSTVEIKVFLKDNLDNNQMKVIEKTAKGSAGVTDVVYETKEEALENFKKQLGENAEVVEGIDANKVMPASYIIKMDGPQYVDGVVEKLKGMEGIDKINDARPVMELLIKITNFVKTVGLALMIVLFIVSIFLISNTIKLTVSARKNEIGIMKYIGATNWFIRWPFVIEGILLGIIGAVISGIIVSYGYGAVSQMLIKDLKIIKLIKPGDIVPGMIAMFVCLGAALGSIGSIISMRKFLNV